MYRKAIRSLHRSVSYGMRLPAAAALLPTINRSPFATLTRAIAYSSSAYAALQKCGELVRNHTDASGLSISRQVLLNEAKDSNTVLSPQSLNVVLSLVAAGASGTTLEEVLKFLKSDSVDDVNKLYSELLSVVLADGGPKGGPMISAANAVWIHKLLPSEKLSRLFCFDADFITTKGDEIVSKVNSWVEKKTNGLIKEVLPPGSVHELTRLILVNVNNI